MTTSYIGKKVIVVGLTREAARWIKRHCGKDAHATLLKWQAERTTVRAPDRKQRTFGPQEATWMKIETHQEIVDHAISLTTSCIAGWVEDRDPVLAQAIRDRVWQGLKVPNSADLEAHTSRRQP